MSSSPRYPHPRHGLSIWFGTALIAAACFVDIFASWNHVRLVHQLNHGENGITRGHPRGAIALALVLALVGIAMAIYLNFGLSGKTC